jgi:ribonuclease P protein component
MITRSHRFHGYGSLKYVYRNGDTARGRIRRRIYETFKEFEPQIQGSPDIVLTIFNDTVAEEPIKNLSKQLKKQLQETGVIK